MFNHVTGIEFPTLVRENFEGKRMYKTEGGDRFPSVTTVLGHKSKPAIKAWRKKVGAATANKIDLHLLLWVFCYHSIEVPLSEHQSLV